ncbi:glycosylphosphatidylinositol anchor biosynthesis [Sorochytrium milnesiophthora]
MTSTAEPKEPWKKLLYIKQDYPDNHVDASFLECLRKNADGGKKDQYWDIVLHTTIITQHASSIMVFIGVFLALNEKVVQPTEVLAAVLLMTTAGFFFWRSRLRSRIPSLQNLRWRIMLKRAVLLSKILLGLSPILKTLTQDTSSDTIWALTACLLLANLLFQDYHLSQSMSIRLSGPLAMNAAIFASVLLASRLPTTLHVFALMLFAVIWFALFPIFRRHLSWASMRYSVGFHGVLSVVTVAQFWRVSTTVVVLYTLFNLVVTFCCPLWLISLQRYKRAFRGPWDEPKLVFVEDD